MKRTSPALALTIVLGLAAPALAGGVACALKMSASSYVPDAKGVVTLSATLERGPFDCGGTGFIKCDPKLAGPLMTVERRGDKGKWVAVASPWHEAEGYEHDNTAPYRLDWNDRLGFSRKAKLEPGTYRLGCKVRVERANYTFSFESKPFQVAAAPKNWLQKLID